MDIIKEMLASKKHLVALAVILIVALNKKLGLGLTNEEIKYIVATAGSLIVGQGVADFGKSRAKIEADNMTIPPPG